MSDSTIDDALRLLEIGKGNPDRLKQIIESFQKRSMISMQDRKYVDALVEQYLTPRHRQMTSKMKPSERQKTSTVNVITHRVARRLAAKLWARKTPSLLDGEAST